MRARSSTALVAMTVALGLCVPTSAQAKRKKKGPTQVVPPKKKKKKEDEDLSKGGERRGVTEFVLGGLTGATALALIGRGIWEITVGRKVKRQCESGEIIDVACERPNPGNGGFVAAGLSFALVVPFGVASGLLINRGVKVNKAYKAWKAKEGTVAFTAGRNTAGVSVGFRF